MLNLNERQPRLLEQVRRLTDPSFYWVDLARFRHNLQAFLNAFRARYSRTSVAYSYKTNYLPALIKEAYKAGCRAEVVSAFEYDIARSIGASSAQIVFNGPVKPEEALRRALTEGAQVHVDSVTEIEQAIRILSQHKGPPARLGIRCTFPIQDNPASQFGLDPTDPEALAAIRRLVSTPGAKVCGVHAHFSTRGRSAASFRERTQKLVAWAEELVPRHQLEFIDVGGGFFGPMPPALRANFGADLPSYDDYGEAVASVLKEKYGNQGQGPELLVEPGAALVADVMGFCTSVVALKRSHGRVHVIVAGSLQNLRPTGRSTASLPYEILPQMDRSAAIACDKAKVMGYTCMETDVILDDLTGSITLGDRFCFPNMGAYTLVFKPPFIAASPPIYAFDEDLKPKLVRRAETAQDALVTYC